MSKKHKNFHYHYAEQYETDQPSGARGQGKRLPVPPFAFFACLVILLMFGFVATSFSVFVTTSINDPDMPDSGGLIVKVRNEAARAAAGSNASLSRKSDADLADTGADVDLSGTGITSNGSNCYIYYDAKNSSGTDWWDGYNRSCFRNNGSGDTFVEPLKLRNTLYVIAVPNGTWTTVELFRGNNNSWTDAWNYSGSITLQSNKNFIDSFSTSSGGDNGASWTTYTEDDVTVSLAANSSTIELCSASASTQLTTTFSSTKYNSLSGVSYSVDKTGATVNSSGVFTATKAGTYTVTATFTYYAKGFSSITATETATTTITVNTCSITSSPASLNNMKIGDTVDVTFTGDSTHHYASKEISVVSSQPDYVSVTTKTAYNDPTRDITVTLTALKPINSVTITATCAGSGATKTLTTKVTAPTLTASNLSLHEGESGTISVTSSGTNASVTPTYTFAKVTAAAPITLANGTASNETIVTAGAYNSSYTSTTVRITASYTVGSSTYTTTKDVTVSLSALNLSIGNLTLFEGQTGTITPVNSTGYEITAYSWSENSSGTKLDITGVDETAASFAAKAKAVSSSQTVTVSLTATFESLNNFQKTVTCTVTIKPIIMTSLSATREEGDYCTFTPTFVSGAPTPSAYGDYPAYQWTTSDTTKIELSNATTDTVTVTTKRLADNTATTANVSLTVYYDTGFTKTFTDIGTVSITKSPYYILGFGPSSGTTNWSTTNEARRMVFNPTIGKYEFKIYLYKTDDTHKYEQGKESGFKLYAAVDTSDDNNRWYASESKETIDRTNMHNNLTFVKQAGGEYNTGIATDQTNWYTITLEINGRDANEAPMTSAQVISSTKKVKVEFPMDTIKIYSNIVGSASESDAMCELSGVTYGTNINPATITSNADFITAKTLLESAGYIFSNTWESDPELDNPLENITDATRKIYAIFVPKSPDFTVSLLPTNRVTAGSTGTALLPYEVPYGSAIKVSASRITPQGVTPAAGITYTWYTYNGSGYTSKGTAQPYLSGENDIVTTVPAGAGDFTLCVQATCVDALGKNRNDVYSSKTVYYRVKSALNDLEMTLNGSAVNQKIYSSAPDLTLKIFADLRAFSSELDSHTADQTKENTLCAKTIELLRYLNGDYTDVISENGSITADTAVPDYKSEVKAQTTVDGQTSDTDYGAKRGVNYYQFRMKSGDAYEDGSSYEFNTVVGTNSSYPTRPLYFENNSGSETPLSNKRVMLFYYDSSAGSLVYQTAQVVDGGSGNLYRFEIPTFKSGSESNAWNGNVWIAAFNKGADDKYALPSYDGSAASENDKLSFSGVSSILYAKTSVVSVIGKQKLTVSEGGISDNTITVS